MITYYVEENNKIIKCTQSEYVARLWGQYKTTEKQIVYGWDGKLYLESECPETPIDVQNEKIRAERQARYVSESDPLRLDYDEALAREQDNAEELKQQWLASKDVIREELPYIVGGTNE